MCGYVYSLTEAVFPDKIIYWNLAVGAALAWNGKKLTRNLNRVGCLLCAYQKLFH